MSLTAEVGWCGLDPRRRPLTGLEQRGCWQQRPLSMPAPSNEPAVRGGRRPRRRHAADEAQPIVPSLDFIPIELVGRAALGDAPPPPADLGVDVATPPMPMGMAEPEEAWGERTSLFGEPEA